MKVVFLLLTFFMFSYAFSEEITPEVQKKRDALWQRWLKDHDFDKDGIITREEYKKGVVLKIQEENKKTLAENPQMAANPQAMAELKELENSVITMSMVHFERFDKDKDGKIKKGDLFK